jgi:hypothetical protein
LDLFEKRFEIYEKTLEFCSVVMRHGSLRRTDVNEQDITRAIKARMHLEELGGIKLVLYSVEISIVFLKS